MSRTPEGCRTGDVRRRTALLGTVAILLLLLTACWSSESVLERARNAAEEGDRARAVALYREYLEEHPDDYDVRKEYALTLGERWAYSGGDRGAILESLERLYEERPGDEQVQDLLSLMLIREGQAALEANRRENAEELYRRAMAVNPDAGTPHYHLGRLYDRWERPEAAFDQFEKAAVERPPIPDLYLRLGRKYLGRGRLDEAVRNFEYVLELRGTSTYLIPKARCGLAEAYEKKGMRREARRHLRDAPRDCEVPGLTRD